MDQLSAEDAITVFGLLSDETASEVLDETGSLVRQELVKKVDDERLADLLEELPMDDAAEFLEDLPDPVADRLLDLMEEDEAEDTGAPAKKVSNVEKMDVPDAVFGSLKKNDD